MSYRHLDASHIVKTAERLQARIRERFPEAGLAAVSAELVTVAGSTVESAAKVGRPILGLRAAIAALLLGIGTLAVLVVFQVPLKTQKLREGELSEVIQTTEASIASIVFLGAAVAFLVSLESRTQRRRCMRRLHELRALAHVVDMHQLTKDPDRLLRGAEEHTASSPRVTLDPFLLGRYLDYCSEMMSLISKIAALYAQASVDHQVMQSVDDIENLTTGLSRKIWQKLMLLEQIERRIEARSPQSEVEAGNATEEAAADTPPAPDRS